LLHGENTKTKLLSPPFVVVCKIDTWGNKPIAENAFHETKSTGYIFGFVTPCGGSEQIQSLKIEKFHSLQK